MTHLRPPRLAIALVTAAALTGPGTARAQQQDAHRAEAMSISGSRVPTRALEGDESVIPGYWEMGTAVTFASPAGGEAAEDMLPATTRLRTFGRTSIGESFEIAGSLALPPKLSTVSDDPPLFGGGAMGRMAVSRRQSLYVAGSAERLLQLGGPRDDGAWTEVAAGWDGRSYMDRDERWIAFSWNAGASNGRILGSEVADAPWLVEAITGIGLTGTFAEDDTGAGFTLGSDFRFPIVSGGDAYWAAPAMEPAMEINPQTRVDLYATLFLHLASGWNVSATYAYRDRGDAASPETILPALEGGYDQSTFTVGFAYSGVRDSDDDAYLAY